MLFVRFRSRLAFAFLLLCLSPAAIAAAQSVSVRAYVDRNAVEVGEQVAFTLEVEGANLSRVGTPAAPAVEGLAMLSRSPSLRRSASIINGVSSQSVAYTWVLRPVKAGSARIGPVRIEIDGRAYKTSPIVVTVSGNASSAPGAQSGGGQEEESAFSQRDLFLRVVPSAQTAFVNEQIILAYRLYFKQGVQVRESRMTDSWDADGFWREDLEIEQRPTPEVVVENGIRYNVITLKRVALFPTRPGTLRVEPLRIQTEAYLPFTGRGLEQFFGFGRGMEQVSLQSPPLEVRAKALPPGAPAGFAGAVGTFRLQTRTGDTRLEAGEALELTATVEGSGNLATLAPPRVEVPGAFERYDPQADVSLARGGAGISGEKSFRYVFVPRVNGRFDLPAVRFSYFDPQAGVYRTDSSATATVIVEGAAAEASRSPAARLPVDDIAGMMEGEVTWVQTGRKPLHRQVWPYAALLLPPALLAAALLVLARRRRMEADPQALRSRRATPAARRSLREAERLLREGSARAFYGEIERAVLGFISNRMGIPERGLTRERLGEALANEGIPEPVRARIGAMLEECDRARFAPVGPDREAMQTACRRAEGIISDLDEQTAAEGTTSA